jgi:hypothetical protein
MLWKSKKIGLAVLSAVTLCLLLTSIFLIVPMVTATWASNQNAQAQAQNCRFPSDVPLPNSFRLISVYGEAYYTQNNQLIVVSAALNLSFQITDRFKEGYTANITAGSLIINDTIYSVTSGNAIIGPYGRHIAGDGWATDGNGNTAHFIFGGKVVQQFSDRVFVKIDGGLKLGDINYRLKYMAVGQKTTA